MRGARRSRGFTVVEMAVALAIGAIVLGGVSSIVYQVSVLPDEGTSRVTLIQEARNLATWLRLDGTKAQSFKAGTSPTYGTFYWQDFSTYPPTRRKVTYYWDDGIVYRQPTTEGTAENPIPLLRHTTSASDAMFTVATRAHDANPQAIEQLLTVTINSYVDGVFSGPYTEATTIKVELRPEQIDPAEWSYYFLHNNPTPPVANTNAQAGLTMTSIVPTATTLYNYDVNRNVDAGLTLVRGPRGGKLDLPDTTKYQDFDSPAFTATAVVDGRATLFLHAASAAFATGNLMFLGAYLVDYNPSDASMTLLIKRGEVAYNSAATWSPVSVHFRPTVHTVSPGHKLRVRLQFDGTSDAEGMVAYDTTTYLSMLQVPFQP